MRKYFGCLFPVFISAFFCFAQDKKQSAHPSFGILGGVTRSTIGGDNDSYSKWLIGWQAGALMFLDFGSPSHFVFGAEANVSSEGWKQEPPAGWSMKATLIYLNVPLVAQLRDPLGFYAEAGVQPGFLLSAKDKSNGVSQDIKDDLNSIDFGIPVGIGYIHKTKIGINVRYIFGVANINKADNVEDH
ncbi:MAG TPA: porin family protein, partial [Chitinophagaceae bacterium]|nr:porin family protein [Chitinophagaceae bacterium]